MTNCAGLLPELEALAKVLEMEGDWQQDAADLRQRMLDIFSSIAESYVKAGLNSPDLQESQFANVPIMLTWCHPNRQHPACSTTD